MSPTGIFTPFLAIKGLRLSKQNKLYVGTKSIGVATFKTLSPSLTQEQLLELCRQYPEDYVKLTGGALDNQLHEAVLAYLHKKQEAETASKAFDGRVLFDAANPIPLERVRVKNNTESQLSVLLYDPATDHSYEVDPKHFHSKIKQHIPDDDLRSQWLASQTDDRIIRYEPFRERDYKKDGRAVFNKWTPPNYLRNFKPSDSVQELPTDLKKVFDHLFPDKKQHPYVLAWMRKALFKRESTVLVLTGLPGSGKGVLFEHFLRQLVGETNWTKAAANFNDSQFHGDIRGVQVFFLNEIKLKQSTKDKLKDFADGRATLSEKFLRNAAAEPIFASFVLANNYPAENWLEYSDRKFYVPTLNDTKLDEAYGVDWVTDFVENTCKDEEFLRSVYNYLWFRVPEINQYPKTSRFYEICELCLPAYFKRFLLFCKNRHEFTEKDLLRGYKGRASTIYDLQQSLEIYQKETRQEVAVITETVSGWTAKSSLCAEGTDEAL